MAITNSKQNWHPGCIVRVGFVTLLVQDVVATPGNYEPDAYLLTNAKGQNYLFVPHRGLTKYDGATTVEAIQKHLA